MNTRLSSLNRPGLIALAILAVVIALVAVESVIALAVLLLEGGSVLYVLTSAALAGRWIVHFLGLKKLSLAERCIYQVSLGLGFLSLIVLALGSVGWLTQPVAFALVFVLTLLGIIRFTLDQKQQLKNANATPLPTRSDTPLPARSASEGLHDSHLTAKMPRKTKTPREDSFVSAFHWLWLLVAPFLAIALLAACLPPGVLWREEGFGYDVLEYHLAVPKFFYETGAISFLPNNVYSNFPLNSEMLSLLMMVLRGDAIEAAYMVHITNVGLACLFVAAAWLAGRTFSQRAGIVAAVLAATTPWIVYLAGIAYVEVGMLAMGMCSLAALLRVRSDVQQSNRWIIAAGLLAGLACGYKYTAVVLILLPLALTVVSEQSSVSMRFKRLAIFVVGALITFSPWMARNVINTHNPVFPLAYSVFGAKQGTWDAELEARWQRGHGSAEAELADTSLAKRVFDRTLGDERMGYLLFVLAAWGAFASRDRRTVVLLAMLAIQFVIWLTATHLFARFAVVFLLPMIVLAARVAEKPLLRRAIYALVALLILGVSWNLYALGSLYYHHTHAIGQPVYDRLDFFVDGRLSGMQHIGTINALDEDAKVLLVGEARTFYVRRPCVYATVFNHHPLAEAARQNPDGPALMAWLWQSGFTHVLAHWDEIDRLQATYGLDSEIDTSLFERLTVAGLKESVSFSYTDKQSYYATLFEVPGHE